MGLRLSRTIRWDVVVVKGANQAVAAARQGAHVAVIVAGAALVVLSFRRGRIEERFGGWRKYLI